MNHTLLLVVTDDDSAAQIERSLAACSDEQFDIERVGRLDDALERLGSGTKGTFDAIVLELALADSAGLASLDAVCRASPGTAVLAITADGDESTGREALRRGAQDWLPTSRLDAYALPKALTGILDRCEQPTVAAPSAGERGHAQITLECIGDAILSIDLLERVTYLNPVASRLTGWPRDEAIGQPLHDVLRILDTRSREPAPDPLAMAIANERPATLGEHCVLIRRDGLESAIEDTATPVYDREGRLVGAVIVFRDVSAQRERTIRISHLAQHDHLTQLPNRMLLQDRLSAAIAAARRHRRTLATLYVDVDHFKGFNDQFGHAVGDELLRSIARRLQACVRESDTVARVGGDEFVVLLSELDRATDATLSASTIIEAMNTPHRIGAQVLRATVSVGIGVFPSHGADAASLLQSADTALLRAKARGRNTWNYFQSPINVPGRTQDSQESRDPLHGASRGRRTETLQREQHRGA